MRGVACGALFGLALLGGGGPLSAQDPAGDGGQAPARRAWTELVRFQGVTEAAIRWRRTPGVAPGTSSDLMLQRMELAGTGVADDWLTAQFVFGVSATDSANVSELAVQPGEIHVDLRRPGTGPYLIVGLRTQPFGQFEAHLITDPLTAQAYAVDAVGLSVGYAAPGGLDIGLTGYRGTALLDALFTSGLFDTTRVRRQGNAPSHLGSLLASALLAPDSGRIVVFAALATEPGADRRNLSADAGLTLTLGRPGLVVDLEHIRAVQRETYAGGGVFKEAVTSATVAWSFVVGEPRGSHGRRSFAGRRRSLRAHPAVAALRYEAFHDGGLEEGLAARTTRFRWSAGGRYTLFSEGEGVLYSMAEVGYRGFRPAGPGGHWEVLVLLGLAF